MCATAAAAISHVWGNTDTALPSFCAHTRPNLHNTTQYTLIYVRANTNTARLHTSKLFSHTYNVFFLEKTAANAYASLCAYTRANIQNIAQYTLMYAQH